MPKELLFMMWAPAPDGARLRPACLMMARAQRQEQGKRGRVPGRGSAGADCGWKVSSEAASPLVLPGGRGSPAWHLVGQEHPTHTLPAGLSCPSEECSEAQTTTAPWGGRGTHAVPTRGAAQRQPVPEQALGGLIPLPSQRGFLPRPRPWASRLWLPQSSPAEHG